MASNIRRYGPLLFLLIHPVFLATVFAFRFLGFISEHLALFFIGAISLEAIYVASFIWVRLTRTAHGLREMAKEMVDMKEDAADLARVQRELIYAGHQIKTLQMDLDALKKGHSIKRIHTSQAVS